MAVIYPDGHSLAKAAGVSNGFQFIQGESLLLKTQVDQTVSSLSAQNIDRVFGRFPYELAVALMGLGFVKTMTSDDFGVWVKRTETMRASFASP